jgi:hypothetical protein
MHFLLKKTIIGVQKISWGTALIVMAIIATAILSLMSPGAAQAEDSQSFSGAPSDGTVSDSARNRFDYSFDPGQSVNDFYYIENTGTLPQDIAVYSTDAFNAEDGTYSLLEGDAPAVGVGSWISFDGSPRQLITLEPQTSKVIPFTVNIPADARPGDHVGGIIASVTSPDGQVQLERRVATRLYVRVSGDLQPALLVSGLSAAYQPDLNPFNGNVVLTYTVTNSGNVALSAKTVSNVSGIFGIPLSGLVTTTLPELFPEGSHVVTVSVPGVWQWVWMNAKISLVGVVPPGASNPGVMPTAEREASTWGVPWGLLVLLIAAAFIYIYIRFSRMNNERRSQQWIDYTEAEARLRAREEPPES